MRKSIKSWRGIFIIEAVVCLLLSIYSLTIQSFDRGHIAILVGVPVIAFVIASIYYSRPRWVEGISEEYLIIETCNDVEVKDLLGADNQDILRAQAALEKYKKDNNFSFSGETLFDQLVVSFKSDDKKDFEVSHIKNTRKFIVEGPITLHKESMEVSGVTIRTSSDSPFGLRIRALMRAKECNKDSSYRVTFVKPIVYNSELSKIPKEKLEKGLSDVPVSIEVISN